MSLELERRRHGLRRAFLVGELSTQAYAWLWWSLHRYGRRWRRN